MLLQDDGKLQIISGSHGKESFLTFQYQWNAKDVPAYIVTRTPPQ